MAATNTFYEALVHWAIGGFALLAIATGVLLLTRQPARRIRVIELTLVGLLALPWLALIPGYPRVAVWPVTSSTGHGDGSMPRGETLPAAQLDTGNPLAEPGADVSGFYVASDAAPALPADVPPLLPAADVLPATPTAAQSEGFVAEAVPSLPLPSYRQWILMAYVIGALAMIVWSLIGLAAVNRLLRSARPADAAIRGAFQEVGGSRTDRVRLLVSSQTAQPCALVWHRPTVVLPAALATGGNARQLHWALAHEWSHIARGDVWSWALAGVARWFCFFQPLFWPLRRQLRLDQDYLADAAAANRGNAPEDYAEFLAHCSSRLRLPNAAAGLGMAGRGSDLERRIVMLVENRRQLEPAVQRRWNLLALLVAALLVSGVAALAAPPATSTAEPQPIKRSEQLSADPLLPGPSTTASPRSYYKDLSQLQPNAPPSQKDGARETENLQQAATLAEAFREKPSSEPVATPKHAASTWATFTTAGSDAVLRELQQRIDELIVQLADATSEKQIQELESRVAWIKELVAMRESTQRASSTPVPAANRARAAGSNPPFSGRLRPGDILKIDLAGGFPADEDSPQRATVEPDGNLALGARYGRFQVGGKSLIEAEGIIQSKLREMLKDPQVQLTYEGHNPDIVAADRKSAAGQPAKHALDQANRLPREGFISRSEFDRRRVELERAKKRSAEQGRSGIAGQASVRQAWPHTARDAYPGTVGSESAISFEQPRAKQLRRHTELLQAENQALRDANTASLSKLAELQTSIERLKTLTATNEALRKNNADLQRELDKLKKLLDEKNAAEAF